MVRNYKPKNPYDPGSKLAPEKTLAIIHFLLAGRKADWIAKKEAVSKNTVSSLSARFRKKLLASDAVRQACLEPFYQNGLLSKEAYVEFYYIPKAPEWYMEEAAMCALQCPAEVQLHHGKAANLAIKAGERVLNRQVTESFMSHAFGNELILVRGRCTACLMQKMAYTKPQEFHLMFGLYLKERKLGRQQVADYYLLFTVHYLIHITALRSMGLEWLGDELALPEGFDMSALPKQYIDTVMTVTTDLVKYLSRFLQEDPLGR